MSVTENTYQHNADTDRYHAEIRLVLMDGESVDEVITGLAHYAGVTAAIDWTTKTEQGLADSPVVEVTTYDEGGMQAFLHALNDASI